MTYELAKALNDSGFPFRQKRVLMGKYEQVWKYIGGSATEDTMATDPQMVPTLEELIEACGDDLQIIHNDHRGWFAGQSDGQDGAELHAMAYKYGQGFTPIEAVANLWLALNKK